MSSINTLLAEFGGIAIIGQVLTIIPHIFLPPAMSGMLKRKRKNNRRVTTKKMAAVASAKSPDESQFPA
jgi:hypothetical protein